MSDTEGPTVTTPKIYYYVYASSATVAFSREMLLDLLTKSRRNNSAVGVTGMLLFKGGNFLQILEGEEPSVQKILTKIQADTRHRGILKLMSGAAENRTFQDWSMAFRDLDSDEVRSMPGFSEFMNQSLDPKQIDPNPRRIIRLLEVFRASIR